MDLRGRPRYPLRNPQGSLLIVALWMIAILTLLSVSVGQHVRQKISLADRIDRRNLLCGISETGIYRTLYKIRQKKEAAEGYHALNDIYTNGKKDFSNIQIGEGAFTISYSSQDAKGLAPQIHFGVEDEEGKININVLDGKTLAKFFQVIGGIEQDLAEEISYAVVDWRDSDDSLSHPKYGAEDDYYEDLDMPYESKDHPFESIEELLLVRGMTPELFERLKPFVTIYGMGVININTAPREVLMGLGMEESLVEKIISYRAGPDSEEGTLDDNVFTQAGNIGADLVRRVKAAQEDINFLNRLVLAERVGVDSKNFRIRSRGIILQKRQILETEAVADIGGKILSWATGLPRRMSPAELEQLTRTTQNV